MKVVVDTNVVAYFLLGTERFVDETRGFMEAMSDGIAPALWEAELANVIWIAIRARVLPRDEGPAKLTMAARLAIASVPTRTLCQGALTRSLASGIAVYDTLFVELAVRERCPLATFDKALLKAYPKIARRPGALVAA